LIAKPPRRLRPRFHGDCVGDALLYGDSLSWGMCHDRFAKEHEPWPSLLRSRLLKRGFRLLESHMLERTTAFNDVPEDPFGWNAGTKPEDFNGLRHFGTFFSSHSPLFVFIMLGTHDLKKRVRDHAGKCSSEQVMHPEWELGHIYKNVKGADVGLDKKAEKIQILTTSENRMRGPHSAKVVAINCATIAEKARMMFDGHCHEGELVIVLIPPPPIRLTEVSKKLGFDDRSVAISKNFQKAFEQICKENDLLCVKNPIRSMQDSTDGVHLTPDMHLLLAEAVWEKILPAMPRGSAPPDRLQIRWDFPLRHSYDSKKDRKDENNEEKGGDVQDVKD